MATNRHAISSIQTTLRANVGTRKPFERGRLIPTRGAPCKGLPSQSKAGTYNLAMRSIAVAAQVVTVLLLVLAGSVDALKSLLSQECYCTNWKKMTPNSVSPAPVTPSPKTGLIPVTPAPGTPPGADTTVEEECEQWKCDEMNKCFPASALVRGEEGQHIRMGDLAVGTKVRGAAGPRAYPPYTLVTHTPAHTSAQLSMIVHVRNVSARIYARLHANLPLHTCLNTCQHACPDTCLDKCADACSGRQARWTA